MSVFHCPWCPYFSDRFTTTMHHVGLAHSFGCDFSVYCGIDGCPKTYTAFHSYRRHLYRSHRSVLTNTRGVQITRSGSDERQSPSDVGDTEDRCTEERNDGNGANESTCEGVPSQQLFSRFLQDARRALFEIFFKVTEVHRIPTSVAETVFKEFEFLLNLIIRTFAYEIENQLRDLSEDIMQLLSCDFLGTIFDGLHSEYKREQYATENFVYVAPEEHHIDNTEATFQYVPLQSLLARLCAIPDIAAHLSMSTAADAPAVLKCFTDGTLYREQMRDIMSESEQYTLFLALYTDEIEIVNPLGAKRGTHKLLCIYMSLLNLHPRYRSQQKGIYLVLLVKYIYVMRYGMDKVLMPLLRDLHQLRDDGIPVLVGAVPRRVKAYLFCVCGDNLSQHRFGGFSCSFGRGRICRYCLASSNLGNLTTEDLCVLRTAQAHEAHLRTVHANQPIAKRLYGVVGESPLLSLGYFDVTCQLPPDIMHDILEGGFEYVLRQVLKSLISCEVITYDDLNKISTFEYGFHDRKSKPEALNRSFITDGAALRGTASQKWCLLRLLPLVIGNAVPRGNGDWEILLLHREIVDIIFCPEAQHEWVPYLQVRIHEFLQAFVQQYPDAHLIPKMHYLVHYPRMIEKLGPLRLYWAMRFEGKHQYFKGLASRVKNFKNICKTLARRHQLLQCIQMYHFSFHDGISTTGGKAVEDDMLPPCAVELAGKSVHEVKQVSIDRCTYRCGDVVVGEGGHKFLQIKRIFVTSGLAHITAMPFARWEFDRHTMCYHVDGSQEAILMSVTDGISYHPLDIYNNSNVVPKWEVYW